MNTQKTKTSELRIETCAFCGVEFDLTRNDAGELLGEMITSEG